MKTNKILPTETLAAIHLGEQTSNFSSQSENHAAKPTQKHLLNKQWYDIDKSLKRIHFAPKI